MVILTQSPLGSFRISSRTSNYYILPTPVFYDVLRKVPKTGTETKIRPVPVVVSRVNSSLFSRALGSFDWKSFKESVKSNIVHQIDVSLEKLILILQEFIILEPKVPIKSECRAPALPPPEKLDCASTKYGTGFTGVKNRKPPKIGILVQFGFDVDVLEIYLNEMYDVVDQFFIIESTKSHFRTLRKALLWEKVKDQERFVKFADKITHFIIDDAENAEVSHRFMKSEKIDRKNSKLWAMEVMQERLRWKKFLEWNAAQTFFEETDILGKHLKYLQHM